MDFPVFFPGRGIPDVSLIGAREELTPHGEFEDATTLHGDSIILRPAYGLKYSIRISNSGPGVWLPCLDDLSPGDEVILHSSANWSTSMSPWQQSKTLRRDPVPGSVHAYDVLTREPVDTAVDGRVVTLFGRAGFTYVGYNPVFDCRFIRGTNDSQMTGRDQGYVLDLVEAAAP